MPKILPALRGVALLLPGPPPCAYQLTTFAKCGYLRIKCGMLGNENGVHPCIPFHIKHSLFPNIL